ncbi:MAG TPA: hypothetical protein VGD71_13200 [Kribbella sp.]|jgi:hypothetical protein
MPHKPELATRRTVPRFSRTGQYSSEVQQLGRPIPTDSYHLSG